MQREDIDYAAQDFSYGNMSNARFIYVQVLEAPPFAVLYIYQSEWLRYLFQRKEADGIQNECLVDMNVVLTEFHQFQIIRRGIMKISWTNLVQIGQVDEMCPENERRHVHYPIFNQHERERRQISILTLLFRQLWYNMA